MAASKSRLLPALLTGASMIGLNAASSSADMMPEEKSVSNLQYELLGRDELWRYGAMESYSEAPFLSELVAAGELPPIEERLPNEPLIHLKGAMLNQILDFQSFFAAPRMMAPVGMIIVSAMAFNAFGDGLRDAMDPYSNA